MRHFRAPLELAIAFCRAAVVLDASSFKFQVSMKICAELPNQRFPESSDALEQQKQIDSGSGRHRDVSHFRTGSEEGKEGLSESNSREAPAGLH